MNNRNCVTSTKTTSPSFSQVSNFLIRWTECLHGAGDLRETFALFAKLTESRLVNLSRFDPQTGRQRIITCFDLDARAGKRPLIKAMAPFILKGKGAFARPGTIWTLGEKDWVQQNELDTRSKNWMHSRGFDEVVVIAMGRDGTDLDTIEFYRCHMLECADDPMLQWLAASAAEAWGRRRKGRIARLLRSVPAISQRCEAPDHGTSNDPLSPDNPYRLTAAEVRICALVQSGFELRAIGAQTGVAEATIRSHLRNIYAKTNASGQVGLVRLLLNSDHPMPTGFRRR